MIHVDRHSVRRPAVLMSREASAARVKAREYFSDPPAARRQTRFEFEPTLWTACAEDLARLFHGKCAYCESPFTTSSALNVDHFRPRVEALGLGSRDTAPDGYWWLAYEWTNLLPACAVCQRNKGTRFPVAGQRALAPATGARLRLERSLLLDPCADRPERHLTFDREGRVIPRRVEGTASSKADGPDRAGTTIELLGLNRDELVLARRQTVESLTMRFMELWTDADDAALADLLIRAFDPASPYAAAQRDFGRVFYLMLASRLDADAWRTLTAGLRLPGLPREQARARTLAAREAGAAELLRSLPARPRTGAVSYLRHIEIENFKAIRRLTLTMPPGDAERAGWLVMLGENGTGKSTVLQAVAMALMGPGRLRSLLQRQGLKPSDLLRRLPNGRRAAKGRVHLRLTRGEAMTLEITPRRVRFTAWRPPGHARGYGPTRLLRRGRAARTRPSEDRVDFVNLFDPLPPVIDAGAWLAALTGRKAFGSAALGLKDLLGIPRRAQVRRRRGVILMPLHGLRHPLSELSSGYESVLALAADVMAGVIGSVRDLSKATGIVLVDEIDAHLHPRWNMRIVDSLRRTFSSMQFLATTHDPLCLRGLAKGEVVVLERRNHHITVLDDLPAPQSMRVDQLLTSNLFGLGSTLDPGLERELTEYYDLLARPPELLEPEERARRDVLRASIGKYENRLMVASARDELLYEAIDEYLAKERAYRGEARRQLPTLRQATKRRVAELWEQVNAPARPGATSS